MMITKDDDIRRNNDVALLREYWLKNPTSKQLVLVYKFVTWKLRLSPIQKKNKIAYKQGETITVKRWDTSNNSCGSGINVAAYDWCKFTKLRSQRVIQLEIRICDIVSMPKRSRGYVEGKFRVKRAVVLT